MKRIPLLLFLFLLCFKQLNGQGVRGNVLYDNPDKLKPVLFLYPWYLNTWKPNGNQGLNFGLKVSPGKMIDFNVDLVMAYKEKQRTNEDLTTFPIFNREEFRIEINGDIVRSNKELRTRYTSTMDIFPKLTQRLVMGVRIGAHHLASTVQGADVNSKLVSFSTGDTSVYNGRLFFSSLNCDLGVSIKSIFNGVITAEGQRYYPGKYMDFYGDAIFNLGYNIHDIDNATDSGYVLPQGRAQLGYRMGLQIHNPAKINMCVGIEFGSNPGIKFNYKPNYFLFKVGLAITDKAKLD